ncbi:MAG: hypothetical protein ACR2QA_12385 [Solirubrobacteraceae bacterium]
MSTKAVPATLSPPNQSPVDRLPISAEREDAVTGKNINTEDDGSSGAKAVVRPLAEWVGRRRFNPMAKKYREVRRPLKK